MPLPTRDMLENLRMTGRMTDDSWRRTIYQDHYQRTQFTTPVLGKKPVVRLNDNIFSHLR